MRLLTGIFIPLILLSVSGCAGNIPREIRAEPSGNPTVSEVRSNIEQYTGTRVRWGGTIASVENRQDETWIEVVARELDSYGQPLHNDSYYGRFLTRIDQFIDPQIYAEGRELTVVGSVEGRIEKSIGEHSYTYPLVRATAYYLWPQYADNSNYYYYPYPYGRYGFHRGHHSYFRFGHHHFFHHHP